MDEKRKPTQENAMVRAFLLTHEGIELDAIQASRMMAQEWGVNIDWHVFSRVLDYLEQIEGKAACVKRGGFCRYVVGIN